MNKKVFRGLENVAIIFFWLLIWELISRQINAFYLPSPLKTGQVLFQLLRETPTYIIIWMSILRVLIGLFLATVIGIFLGILSGLSERIFRFLQPIMVAIKSTPVVSFIIIAMIYLKAQNVPIFCGMLLCIPIIYYNVIEGLSVVDKQLINMAKVYRVRNKKMISKIYMPSIIPYINAGILTGIGISWKGTIAAEVIGVVRNSIGFNLYNAKVYLDIPELFAWTVIIILFSLLIESFAKVILRRGKYYKGLKVT